MPRYSSHICFLFMLTLCLVAGCEGDESVAPPKTGWVAGTLRLGHALRLPQPRSGRRQRYRQCALVALLFQPLLDYDAGVNLVPLTAEAMPTLSKDGKTYTFHLRKDVHFSNGRAVTADDYLYAWRRVTQPQDEVALGPALPRIASPAPQDYANGKATDIKGLHAPDPYTLEVELIHPDLTFLYVAAMPFLAPVPREAVEDVHVPETDWNDHFALHPVGNGPFVLRNWQRGLRMRLERDPHYWGPTRCRLWTPSTCNLAWTTSPCR